MPCVMLVMYEGSLFACSFKLNLHVAQYTIFMTGLFCTAIIQKGSNFVDASLEKCYKLCRSGTKFDKEPSPPNSLKAKAAFHKSATKTLAKLHRSTGKSRRAWEQMLSEVDAKEYGAAGPLDFWEWRVSVHVPPLRYCMCMYVLIYNVGLQTIATRRIILLGVILFAYIHYE